MSRHADDWFYVVAEDSVSVVADEEIRSTIARIGAKAADGLTRTSCIYVEMVCADAMAGQRIIQQRLPKPGITLNRGKIQQTFRLKPTTEQ